MRHILIFFSAQIKKNLRKSIFLFKFKKIIKIITIFLILKSPDKMEKNFCL